MIDCKVVNRMRLIRILLALLVPLLLVSAAMAAKLVLKDGTVLEGTVIKQGDGYWVKTPDGQSRIISNDDVASVDFGESADSGVPAVGGSAAGSSEAFPIAHARADDAESALAAVSIWQQFVDRYPDSPDIVQAKQQLEHWKEMAKDGAEKINGRWVSGAEREEILKKANELTRDAHDMLLHHQMLQAVDKLQEAVRIYPNSVTANFILGDVNMFEKHFDEAQSYYQTAVRLMPQSAAALNNLAVCFFLERKFEQSIDAFQQAVKNEDSKDLVQNLVTAISMMPSDIRTEPRLRSAIDDANLLASNYSINGPDKDFRLMAPPSMSAPGASKNTPAWAWEGTGFVINGNGMILTNRHVAKNATTLLVVCGKQQMSADVVAIDDDQDLALIQVKPKKPLPFLHLSPDDNPRDGADITVMGFPLEGLLGTDIKITRGIVSASNQDQGNGADVLLDVRVNPGNSGGPILDKYGNVIAIVSMKTRNLEESWDSYGIGISAGHIREFLAKHHIETTPGTQGQTLSTEEVVSRAEPATVNIFATGKASAED